VEQNVVKFIGDVGIERVGLLTLTFKRKVYSIDEASRHFNSINSRVLKEFFGRWIKVIDPHHDGAWHFHLLVEVSRDIRTGFNFEAFKASEDEFKRKGKCDSYYRLLRAATSPGHALPGMWKELRKRLARYKFGRFELVPIRTNPEAISKYLSKFLSQGVTAKRPNGKGIRLVAYSKSVDRAVRMGFAWASSGAREWRKKLAMAGTHLNCQDIDDFGRVAGPGWAYRLGGLIAALVPDDTTQWLITRKYYQMGEIFAPMAFIYQDNKCNRIEQIDYVRSNLTPKPFDSVDVLTPECLNDITFRTIAFYLPRNSVAPSDCEPRP
jgi:hypothetical protein